MHHHSIWNECVTNDGQRHIKSHRFESHRFFAQQNIGILENFPLEISKSQYWRRRRDDFKFTKSERIGLMIDQHSIDNLTDDN